MMKTNSITEFRLNFNWGMIAFVFHRITGIALSLYVFLHIWTLSAVKDGSVAFNHSLGKYDNLFGHVIEYLLLLAVAFHLFNGIRITFVDFLRFSRQHKRMLAWVIILLLAVAIISLTVFFPELGNPA